MKSFTVTKEMRKDIAQKLTARAISSEVKAINDEAAKLNSEFWKDYKKRLRAVSGIPSTQWKKLVQIGMVQSIIQASPESSEGNPVARVARNRILNENLQVALCPAMRQKLWKNFTRFQFSKDSVMKFVADSTMPRFNGCEEVTDADMLRRISAICDRQQALLGTIVEFHNKTMQVLNSCRTAKQMRELFPEGAKLLPTPVDRTTDLAPKELAESVTKMIENGVPPVREG